MTSSEPLKYKLFRARTSDQWGFKITTYNNQTYITGVYDKTPASAAGLVLNEIIVSINRVPCENVPHDYIYHVIKKVDHNMTLVTRKPLKGEECEVAELTRDMPIKGFYLEDDTGDFSKLTKEGEAKRHSRPPKTPENRQREGKMKGDEEKERKKRPTTTTDTGEKEETVKLRQHKQQQPQEQHQQHDHHRQHHHRDQPNDQCQSRGEKSVMKAETREVNGVNCNGKSNTLTDHGSKSKESKAQKSKKTVQKTESRHLVKSKSSADMASRKTRPSGRVESGEKVTTPPLQPSFPSMHELRTALPAGKRRTLLLNNVESFEDRVACLNEL